MSSVSHGLSPIHIRHVICQHSPGDRQGTVNRKSFCAKGSANNQETDDNRAFSQMRGKVFQVTINADHYTIKYKSKVFFLK